MTPPPAPPAHAFTTDARLKKAEDRLDQVDNRLDKMDIRFDKVDNRLDKIEDRLGKVEEGVENLQIESRQARYDIRQANRDIQREGDRLDKRIMHFQDLMTEKFNVIQRKIGLNPLANTTGWLYWLELAREFKWALTMLFILLIMYVADILMLDLSFITTLATGG